MVMTPAFSAIEVGEAGSYTLTSKVAFTFLSHLEVAVMVTLPAFLPVTTPSEETRAMDELLVLHLTSVLVPDG